MFGHEGGDDYNDHDDQDLMEMYSIDDSLDAISKLERYHTSDFSLQRLMLVRELADTAKDAGFQASHTRMLPLLTSFVSDTEPAVRQNFVDQLYPLASYLIQAGGDQAYNDLLNVFLPYCFELLVDKNVEVGTAAVNSLTKLVHLVKNEHLESQLLHVVSNLAQDERSEDYRVAAAQLMNELAERFGEQLCKQSIVKHMKTLSEDSSFMVRKTVASNLGKLGKQIGSEAFAKELLPVYCNLAKDDIWGVRKACAESICAVSQIVPSEQRTTVLFDIFERFADDVSRWVRVAAYQQLGPLLSTCSKKEIPQRLLKRFTDMGLHGEGSSESDMAEYCAFCFPAVVQVVGPERWSELESTFLSLVKNVQWKVRKMLSHSLHEIARIVGREISEKSLVVAFDLFLRDLDEVKIGIVQNLSEFLATLGQECREKYIPLIFQLPQDSDNWRLRYMVAQKLGAIAALVSTSVCKGKIAEMGIKLLEDSVADVRQAAFPAAGQILMRLCSGAEEDRQEFLKYIKDLPTNANFQTRQMFAYICAEVGKSEDPNVVSVFEQHFIEQFTALGHDKVPNVRIAVAKVLSQSITSTRYAAKFKPLREALSKDPDRDVAFFASQQLATPKESTT